MERDLFYVLDSFFLVNFVKKNKKELCNKEREGGEKRVLRWRIDEIDQNDECVWVERGRGRERKEMYWGWQAGHRMDEVSSIIHWWCKGLDF